MKNSLSTPVNRRAWIFFALLVALRFIAAAQFPVMEDETYYLAWSKYPAWGYFDHPPMIAWLAFASSQLISPSILSPFSVRFAPLILSLASGWLTWNIAREIFPKDRAQTAFLLGIGNLVAAACVLLTPDAPLLFFAACTWLLALRAIKRTPYYWLGAGLCMGLALLSKYTAVLIALGPLIAWIFFLRRRAPDWRLQSRRHGPWVLGGIATALLVLLPHLVWLSQHNWISVSNQLQHGLAGSIGNDKDRPAAGISFPAPERPLPGSAEFYAAKSFAQMEDRLAASGVKRPKPVEPELSRVEKLVQHQGGLWGAIVGAWGVMAIPLFLGIRHARRKRRQSLGLEGTSDFGWRIFLTISALTPLGLFTLTAFGAKVEANWPAIYIIAGAGACASWLPASLPPLLTRGLISAALMNQLLLVAFTMRPTFFPSRWYLRPDRETSGLATAASLKPKNAIVLTETFQQASQLRLLTGELATQWPGLARDSEFTRLDSALADEGDVAFRQSKQFVAIGSDTAPSAGDFRLMELRQIRACQGQIDEVITAENAPKTTPICIDPLRILYVGRYERLSTAIP